MAADKERPVFERRIFWDVNFEALDYDTKAPFIIERVFDRGDVEDIRQCRRYYGDKIVHDTLLNARFLSERRLPMASAVIGEPVTAFRCYTLKQSPRDVLHIDPVDAKPELEAFSLVGH